MENNFLISNKRGEEIILKSIEGVHHLNTLAPATSLDISGFQDLRGTWISQLTELNSDYDQTVRVVFDAAVKTPGILLALSGFMYRELTIEELEQGLLRDVTGLGEIPKGFDPIRAQCLMYLLHLPSARVVEAVNLITSALEE